jgi:hypothetical protein
MKISTRFEGATMTDSADNSYIRIGFVAQTLPCLQGVPGIAPWNAVTLDVWAVISRPKPSPAQHSAVQFLLSVWDPQSEWRSGRFDVMSALRVWDSQHREAFFNWARNPWWVKA